MAEDPTAPSLNLTPEEKRIFGQLFRQADTESVGVVTGEVAVKFFEKTRLEPRVLGEIWQIADKENRGFLTPAGFGIVLRLIGHYQAGRDPTSELALRPGPLPKFDGAPPGGNAGFQPPPGPPPNALQPQPSGSGPIRVPPLTPEKAGQYAALFEKSGAQNGVLPGEQAKSIFERAGLPNEILGRIWMLSDTEQRGSLQATEFVIAMHLLASFKSGAMRALPNQLPAGLYEAAARRPPSRQTSLSGSVSAIPRQFSGNAPRVGSPLGRTSFAPQQFPQTTGNDGWAITPADKAKFDGIYNNLDRAGRGYITGEEAVPFFSESKLPEEALAQIWDLADINSAGVLSRDEFAVAMYLIRQQRGKRDGRDFLPDTLPANLVPPSMRNVKPSTVNNAPNFDTAAPTMPKSAAEDLFGLDALAVSPPPTQVPQSTGGSASFGVSNDLFASKSPVAPSSPVQNTTTSGVFKPFAPSSSFGQQLTYNSTGGSNAGSSRPMPPQHTATDDLLGDDDPEFNSKITNDAAELGNLSNQVGSLSKQMQDVQSQRSATQNELNQASAQKQQFEQRLSQLRALYEKEVKDVKGLEERLTTSRNETKKLQTEIAMLEGAYQDLQSQHQQSATALHADQQENTNLKERMRAINAEIAQMKPALEKLRSDARQQKGLVAINKKQLATSEGEREKLKTESEELNKSIEEDSKILAQASSTKSPSPSQVVSPAASTMSANNPFFRRQGSTNDFASSPFASPSAGTSNDRSFENVFGPSFDGASSSTSALPPPPTTFKQNIERSDSDSAFTPKSTSPTLSSRETPFAVTGQVPPPPPESRQISSSFLPFPDHVDSVSSSRQVSAPNSRFGDDTSTPGASTPTGYVGVTPGSSTTGQPEASRSKSPENDSKKDWTPPAVEHKDSIPGAFPGDPNSDIVATPTGGSTLSESTADPFGKPLERSGTAKSDFDSAFAGFGTAKPQERTNTGSSSAEGSNAPAPTGVNKEFPPIAEMDDDDSDSASEAGGFDDNFAPTSSSHSRQASSSQNPPVHQEPQPSELLSARPAFNQSLTSGSLNSTSPPTPNEQLPPPTYDKVVSPQDKAQHEVEQFSGLLPRREDPTSPGTISPEQSSLSMAPPQVNAQQSVPAPPAKVPFDDDFDEFDGLEDAKEGGDDDDFANTSTHDRSGLDDFNPMFDSAPAGHSASASRQSNDAFGNSSQFGNFGQSTSSMNASQTQNNTKPVNDNQDWDAIFAGLDEPAHAANTSPPPAASAEITANGAATSATSNTTKTRPEIGRALTEAGVHDDPILKNLTEMGYARSDALKALEKYDYNMERAANYLASQS